MAPVTYSSSRSDAWAVPHWRLDPSEQIYGPIRPMYSRGGGVGRLIDWLRRHLHI